jgi:hypothetical protein
MSLDWPSIIGTLLAGFGGLGSLLYGGKWFLNQRKAIIAPIATEARSADAGPPAGAVEWVVDIIAAMSESQASCILEALEDSCSRDQARARRIEQLEATPWARSPMVAAASSVESLAGSASTTAAATTALYPWLSGSAEVTQ